jgi:hypothetical protein
MYLYIGYGSCQNNSIPARLTPDPSSIERIVGIWLWVATVSLEVDVLVLKWRGGSGDLGHRSTGTIAGPAVVGSDGCRRWSSGGSRSSSHKALITTRWE